MNRKILGFVVAPFAPAMVGALFFGIRSSSVDLATSALSLLVFSGYVGALLIAFPAVLLFERFRWANFRALALLGVGSAFLLSLLAAWILPSGRNVTWIQGFVNLCSVSLPVGFLAGACFWFVVRPKRPAP
jgi:hypothetical protein